MRKKLLSLALAMVLSLSLIPSALAMDVIYESAADIFTDVSFDAWYLNELNYAVANGYISGTSATTFSPKESLTRGQFVTILGRMLGVSTSSGKTKFTDVDEKSWYAPYVAWAAENGIVNGTSATTFAPNSDLTVEQMATILVNYISKSGVTLTGCKASPEYKDASRISDWAVANMEVARQYGLLHTEIGEVHPWRAARREEGAYTLVKFARAAGLGVEPHMRSIADREFESGRVLELEDVYARNAASAEVVQSLHDKLWDSGEINSSMSEKERAIVYFDWMCKNCKTRGTKGVEVGPAYWNSAYAALVDHDATQFGIKWAYQGLMQAEGFEVYDTNPHTMSYTPIGVYLDGEPYEIDIDRAVRASKDFDGSYSEFAASLYREKYFYPKDYEANNKGFGPTLTAEEQQRYADAKLQIDYTRFTDELDYELVELVHSTPVSQWEKVLNDFIDSHGIRYIPWGS